MQNRKILFARIGYMRYYEGPQSGDEKPMFGGEYNENDIGLESDNYKNVKRNVPI